MGQINTIVNVNVSAQTAGVVAKAFGVGLIVGNRKNFDKADAGKWRVKQYNSLAAVLVDFADTTAEHKAAAAYFKQNPSPEKVLIGQIWKDGATSESVGAALSAITNENGAWYILILANRTQANQIAASTWVANDKGRVFITASDEAAILTSATTETTSLWYKTMNDERTLILYKSDAATEYADAGLAGVVACYQPGEYTLKFKNIRGAAADALADDAKNNCATKGVNTYTEVGGRYIIENGKSNIPKGGDADSGGEWFDIIVFCDWLRARIAEGVYSVMINAKKIPYTDVGIAMIETPTRAVLGIGMSVGGISPHEFDEKTKERVGGYEITKQKASAVPKADKIARKYSGLSALAYLQGAIHYAGINITITY